MSRHISSARFSSSVTIAPAKATIGSGPMPANPDGFLDGLGIRAVTFTVFTLSRCRCGGIRERPHDFVQQIIEERR